MRQPPLCWVLHTPPRPRRCAWYSFHRRPVASTSDEDFLGSSRLILHNRTQLTGMYKANRHSASPHLEHLPFYRSPLSARPSHLPHTLRPSLTLPCGMTDLFPDPTREPPSYRADTSLAPSDPVQVTPHLPPHSALRAPRPHDPRRARPLALGTHAQAPLDSPPSALHVSRA